MRHSTMFLLTAACVCALFALASCDSLEVYRLPGEGPGIGNGPPPHAKAHGYRRKQVDGYDLVFDSECSVYVVVGLSNCYYHNGCFYRLQGDNWQASLRADSGWAPATRKMLPPGLQAKTTGKFKSRS